MRSNANQFALGLFECAPENDANSEIINGTPAKPVGALVFQFAQRPEFVSEPQKVQSKSSLTDLACGLCEETVCANLEVPICALRNKTRSNAEVSLARQIAMYLAHTTFSVLMTEVGSYFDRDRTTVSHACNLVEDKRDEFTFDTMMCQLESALESAADAYFSYLRPQEFEENRSNG